MHHDEMSEINNISFDSDINEDRENVDPLSRASQSHWLMSGSLQILGNLTHKNNEHVIYAIMRQDDCNGLLGSLGYPIALFGLEIILQFGLLLVEY
jgi:hypothetical protein